MAISTVVEGALVAHHARSYKFTDRSSGQPVEGVTRRLFVVESFDQEPHSIQVKDPDLFAGVVALGAGAKVRLECEVVSRNDRPALVLVQALPVEAKRQAG